MMGFKSEVLGKIAATLREEQDGHANWTYSIEVVVTDEQAQALANIVHTVGDVQVKKVNRNKFLLTLPTSTAAEEAVMLTPIIERFIRTVDRGARQRRETPLAVNSAVPIHGHHEQD